MLSSLSKRVNANAALVRRGRYVTLVFLFGIDADDYLISIEQGQVTSVTPRRLGTDSGVFTIRASAEAWARHWESMPPRDYHDIWSMLPKGLVAIDGDLVPFIQNLQYFKDVIATLRVEGE
jgi:hypothetical protein